MNKNQTKLTDKQIESRGWKVIERDTMPYQVATDLLCEAGIRQTNGTRKAYRDARQRSFRGVCEKKPAAEKMTNRLHDVTLLQLGKWTRRAWKRRRGLQLKHQSVTNLLEHTAATEALPVLLLQRRLAAINLLAGQVDLFLDTADTELNFRMKLTRGVLPVEGAFLRVFGVSVFSWTAPTFVFRGILAETIPGKWSRIKVPNEIAPEFVTR